MKDGYIELEECLVHYLLSNENQRETIIFLHGNSGSARTWQQQLDSPLLSQFRLLAFDLPGHGKSSPTTDYSPLATGRTLARAITQTITDAPIVMVGFSYGTNLIAETINNGIMPVGIVMIAMCCIGKDYSMDRVFRQSDQPPVVFYNENDQHTVRSYFGNRLLDPDKIDFMTEDYFQTDINFRPSLVQSVGEGRLSDEMETIRNFKKPLGIIYGSEDDLVLYDYLESSGLNIWKGKINKLENAGHFVYADKPDQCNELLATYANEQFKASHA